MNDEQIKTLAVLLLAKREQPRLKPDCSYYANSIDFCAYSQRHYSSAFPKCEGCPVGKLAVILVPENNEEAKKE